MVGYLHDLSPVKLSINNNPYFDLKFQTSHRVFRAICFSSEKHDRFKRKYESSSPVKLSRFQIKVNQRTNQKEIHINKISHLIEPNEDKVTFDFAHLAEAESEDAPFMTVDGIKNCNVDKAKLVTTFGRVTFRGSPEIVLAKGKSLKKQEALLTGNSGTVRIVLWDAKPGWKCLDP